MRPEEAAGTRSHEQMRYLISFDDGAMTFPEEELPDVDEAAHAVVQEAKDAGVWVFGGGLKDHGEASMVATDGTVTDGPYPESKQYLGGFAVVEVPSPEEALEWAAKFAVACRCAQEVREILSDPTV
ncbi:MAG: YciI family protein [Candidatus Dormiibacterota bacterium]